MSSFLFTTIAAVVGVVMLAPSYATNIPTTNPGCTTTVLGADNVANRSAALEPDFHANTINTTWYSNGEPLTGNNIPGTCTYDAALTPPTPAARPGYVFNGWTLRVVAPAPVVPTLSTISNETVTAYGYYTTDCGGECGPARETLVYNTNGGYWDYDLDNPYDLSEMGQWGITFGTNVVKGESGCSFDSEDFPSGSGDNGEYCWCRVTSFTPDNGTEQEFTGSSWVFYAHMGDFLNCGECASSCVTEVKNNSNFRSSVFDAAQ